ncbi:MAG: hypothetical protein U0841_20075 [Chloroflexia bacterium]
MARPRPHRRRLGDRRAEWRDRRLRHPRPRQSQQTHRRRLHPPRAPRSRPRHHHQPRHRARAAELIPHAAPDAPVILATYINGTSTAAPPLLTHEGYQIVRHYWRMSINLDAPPPAPIWPAGITPHTFVPGQDDARTHATIEDAFADMWNASPVPFADWHAHMIDRPDFNPTLWTLALDGDEVAGHASATTSPSAAGSATSASAAPGAGAASRSPCSTTPSASSGRAASAHRPRRRCRQPHRCHPPLRTRRHAPHRTYLRWEKTLRNP